jgi:hypothetical protein
MMSLGSSWAQVEINFPVGCPIDKMDICLHVFKKVNKSKQ